MAGGLFSISKEYFDYLVFLLTGVPPWLEVCFQSARNTLSILSFYLQESHHGWRSVFNQ